MKIHQGFLCPQGTLVSEIHTGVKSEKYDLGLIFFPNKARVSAVNTQTQVKGAHIIVNQDILNQYSHLTHGVLINSGIANTLTGQIGINNALHLLQETASQLKLQDKSLLMCSTGVVGHHLSMDKMLPKIPTLCQNLNSEDQFGESILTTDTHIKQFSYENPYKKYRITGVCKGAGMIHPRLATMLAFIITDVAIPQEILNQLLKDCTKKSFNSISIDGDTSPNDTVLLLSTQDYRCKYQDLSLQEQEEFKEYLEKIFIQCAQSIVRDGEGATKWVEITIENAPSETIAQQIASEIGQSLLVKTALFGEDPNWGRILCAAGKCSSFQPDQCTLKMQGYTLFNNGQPSDIDLNNLQKELQKTDITITLDLHNGSHRSQFWTTDLSYEYVKINAEYHT